jgi:hypothetical protein
MKSISIFLVIVAFVMGMVGCGDGGNGGVEYYTLTISRTAGGSVTEPGEGTFTYNATTVVNLVAEADEGYYFVNWTGDVGAIDNVKSRITTIAMHGDYAITANFELIPPGLLTLTVYSSNGGSVSEPGEGTFIYDEGTLVDLVAGPDVGYHFGNWTGDVGTIGNINAASTNIIMNGNYIITANFVKQYALTISSTAGGNVSTPGVGTFTYDAGTVVSLVASPVSSYHFLGWTGDVSTIANVNAASTTITVNGDYSITANFYHYEIWDWYDLNTIRNNLGGSYVLMCNLDSNTAGYTDLASPTANVGKGWDPIGSWNGPLFTGTFDGQGYEIRDLFINRSNEAYVGPFGVVGGTGVIKNVGVVNVDVTGSNVVGGLVGCNRYDGTVSNSYSTGSVTGNCSVGGLVGLNCYAVSDSYSAASVIGVGEAWAVGGLIGEMGAVRASVKNSYFTGTVIGSLCVGGLVGQNVIGSVSNSYYNYDEVLINGQNIITVGALFNGDFVEWLANGKFLDVNKRLSIESGSYGINNVSDFKQLLAFGQDASLKFRLKTNLDLGNETNFYIPYLAGEFDGNGHTISNLSFNFDFVSDVGLFGCLGPYGNVTRVGVENVNITGSEFVGGLVGNMVFYGTVSNSYSTGSVTCSDGVGCVGGLVGYKLYGTVTNCYSSATATAVIHVAGGLVGYNEYGTVSNSYSTGTVTGGGDLGGLVALNLGTVSNSFWDTESSGQSTSAEGTGKTTAQMMSITTFSSAGWNVIGVANASTRNPAYIWNIVAGVTYPLLSWQPLS